MDVNAIGDWVWASLEQLSVIAPLGALLAVIVAYFSYRGTIGQRTLADNRDAWWNRVAWAIDAALSDHEQRRATGMAAIEQLQDSELALNADQALLAAMANAIVDETVEALEFGDGSKLRSTNGRPDGEKERSTMTDQEQKHESKHSSAYPGKHPVLLVSRDEMIIDAKTMTQKRILESAERIIAKANEKLSI